MQTWRISLAGGAGRGVLGDVDMGEGGFFYKICGEDGVRGLG